MKKSKPSKTQSVIRWNIISGAHAFGVSRDKLKAALVETGIPCGRGADHTTLQIHTALSGSFRHESVLLKRAKRKLAELELQEKERVLIDREEVAAFILDTYRPLREFICSQPGRLAASINPADPKHARDLLERERDEFIRLKPKLPPGKSDEQKPEKQNN
jgi:hypothetical protein